MGIKILPKKKTKKIKDVRSNPGQSNIKSVRTGRKTSGVAFELSSDSPYKMKKDGTKVDYLLKSIHKRANQSGIATAKSGVGIKDTVDWRAKDQTGETVTAPKYKKLKLKVEGPGGKFYKTGGKVSKNWASCGANIITGRD